MNRNFDQIADAIERDTATLDSRETSTLSRVIAGVAVLHHQAVIGREVAAAHKNADGVLFYAERQRRIAEIIGLLSQL